VAVEMLDIRMRARKMEAVHLRKQVPGRRAAGR